MSTKVTLTSSDNTNFSVEKAVAERSVLLKNMLEDVGESDTPIPLPNVTGRTLKKASLFIKERPIY
jgi:S-phase kinase-associated protein 1